MTYEERQKAICKECTDYNTSKCPYVIRSLRCSNLSNQMEGWELGYRDAIEKACKWLRRTQPKSTLPDTTIERFRKAMEEEQ